MKGLSSYTAGGQGGSCDRVVKVGVVGRVTGLVKVGGVGRVTGLVKVGVVGRVTGLHCRWAVCHVIGYFPPGECCYWYVMANWRLVS